MAAVLPSVGRSVLSAVDLGLVSIAPAAGGTAAVTVLRSRVPRRRQSRRLASPACSPAAPSTRPCGQLKSYLVPPKKPRMATVIVAKEPAHVGLARI